MSLGDYMKKSLIIYIVAITIIIIIGIIIIFTSNKKNDISMKEQKVNEDISYIEIKDYRKMAYVNNNLYVLKNEGINPTKCTIAKGTINNGVIEFQKVTQNVFPDDSSGCYICDDYVYVQCDSCDDAYYYDLDLKILNDIYMGECDDDSGFIDDKYKDTIDTIIDYECNDKFFDRCEKELTHSSENIYSNYKVLFEDDKYVYINHIYTDRIYLIKK